MNRQDIENRVREIISEELDISKDQIQLESVLSNGMGEATDLCADSLDLVEMLITLEEEFGIEVPDDDAAKIKTVGDIVNYVESHT